MVHFSSFFNPYDFWIPSLASFTDLHLFHKTLFPVLSSTLNIYLRRRQEQNKILKEESDVMGSGDETSFKENISRSFMRLGFQISPFTSVLTQDYWAALMLCWSCDRVYAKFDWYFKVFFVVFFFNCPLHIWPIPCNSNRSMSQRKTLNICTCIVLPCLNSQLFFSPYCNQALQESSI